MNTNNDIMQQVKKDISFKDIFDVLWSQKITIICITLIISILAGIYSMFILEPVYQTKLNIIIKMPEIYHTQYGDYTMPLTSNQQYINLIKSNDVLNNTIIDMGDQSDKMDIEDLGKRIYVATTTSEELQNSFEVVVEANEPDAAKQLAQVLYENYTEFLDSLILEGAIDSYIDTYTITLRSLETELNTNREILKKNEKLLTETPQTINQKNAMDEVLNQANTSDFIVLEDVINSNYVKIENDIIINKQKIYEIENSITTNNSYLDELNKLKNDLMNSSDKEKFVQSQSSLVSVIKTNVYLPSLPVAPSQKTSPSNSKNVIFGAMIGGMMGVMISLAKVYLVRKK